MERKDRLKTIQAWRLFCDTHVHFVYNKEDEQPVEQKNRDCSTWCASSSIPRSTNGYYRFYSGTACSHRSELLTLSNELVDFKVHTCWFPLQRLIWKKFHTYDSLPVYLAKGNDHSFDLVLTAKDGRKIHTKDLVFKRQNLTNGRESGSDLLKLL
jgi:YidC/Oxa1 family membrane protein insertase